MENLLVFNDIIEKIDGVEAFRQRKYSQKDRADFDNKLRKFFFFLVREGFNRTYKKIKSSQRYQRHLDRYLTFIKIKKGSEYYLNVSIQSQCEVEKCVIRNSFYHLKPEADIEEVIRKCTSFFEEDGSYFNQFSDYKLPDVFNNQEFIKLNITHWKPTTANFEEGVFIFGLGGYAYSYILPEFRSYRLIACVDYKAERADNFKKEFGFELALYHPFQAEELLRITERPIVIIATYHSDHATLANWAFQVNKKSRIFVEKPPCVNLEDLNLLSEVYKNQGNIEIGFNRRYVPINKKIKEIAKGKALIITFSVKEVLIEENHWYYWRNQGSRITGNLVHWIDLANYWIDSDLMSITLNTGRLSSEDISISIAYRNGSLVNITASDKGNSLRGVQELIEIRFDNETILIQDYLKYVHIKSSGKKGTRSFIIRDKGHTRMYKEFRNNLKSGAFCYSLKDLERTSNITIRASKMLMESQKYSSFPES